MIEKFIDGEVLLSKTLSEAYREAWPSYLTFTGPYGGFEIRRYKAFGIEIYVDAHPLLLTSLALSIFSIFFGYVAGLMVLTLLFALLLVFGAILMLFGEGEFGVVEWTQGLLTGIGLVIWN